MDRYEKLYGNELVVRMIVHDLCITGEKFENISLKRDGDILTVNFNNGKTTYTVILTLDEIISEIKRQKINDEQVRDFILFTIIREKLVKSICSDTCTKIGEDVKKHIETHKKITKLIETIFPDN